MAPGAAERDVIALGAEGAMDHAIEPGAVQGDEGRGGTGQLGGIGWGRSMLRPYTMLPVQQVFHPPQIPRSFFSDRRREQNGPRHRHACRDHRLRHRDQRGEAARVVRNAGALEPLAAPLHRDVHLGPEDRVEMGRQYDRRGLFAVLPQPPVDITRVIDHDVAQADRAEQLRHVRGAPAFGARGRGNGGERRLAGERPLIGALDVMARRANALVREQAGNKIVHQSDSQCSHKPPAARRKRACGLRHAACGLWLSGRHLLMDERELIYDWNRAGGEGGPAFDWSRVRVDLNDETLRDGLQSPSVRDPALEVKKRLLHLMADLGIVAADIGLPGAGPRVVEQVRALATEIRNAKLPIAPNCAARTVIADIEPIVRVAQEVGIPIEAATFIGSSPIRQYAEDWTLDRIVQSTVEGVTYAVKHGLPVMYVTEDTTRAKPEALKALYGAAIDCGATRICLADTVGHATPAGVKTLVEFVKREIVKQNRVKVDWHGHRDRGLGLINCLTAIEAGVDRVHGTALGVGERVGNAEMDLLIVNLKLLGAHAHDISKLPEYCRLVADAVGVPIAVNYPVMGEDAFRTGTGVHAAAIIKAKKKGHAWLADRVYSSVPAQEFGLEQKIEISPVSGLSNVKYWLETHGYDPEDEAACRALFEAAKRTDRVLSDEECHRLLKQAAWR